MIFVLIVFGFAIGWAALTGSFTVPSLLLGAVLGTLAAYVAGTLRPQPAGLRRLRRIGSLALLFVTELLRGALRVASLVVRSDVASRIAPAVVAFPLTVRGDAEIALLANLITLTPGTLSIEVSRDRRSLYIHVLECRDRGAFVQGIAAGFERKVIEVFQ